LGIERLSATFHGRDLFAPLAAELAAARVYPAQIGTLTTDWVPALIDPPARRGQEIHGVVVTTDHFGNLITNIDATDLAGCRVLSVRAAGHRIPFHRTYGDVTPGSFLALVNSFEVLEIAVAEQNAATLLGLGRGGPVVVECA
jgi:S-adenosylmethionine hydrolase